MNFYLGTNIISSKSEYINHKTSNEVTSIITERIQKMYKVILYFLIMTLSTTIVFAEDTDVINNEIKENQWTHKITFENKSEFRFDIDELTPGLQNQSQIEIKFKSPEKNKEIGKDDPFSAYIKIENVGFKAQGTKDAILKIDLGEIIANIKIYDFYLKMESMTNFDFNQESLFSFAPMTGIQSKYYGFPSKNRDIGQKIFSKSKVKRTGTLQFGYNLLPQIEFLIAIGAIGTGNRNHQKNNDDSEEEQKKKKKLLTMGLIKA
ncbi:P66 protein precursor [Borrelia miyamotoi FR64b]|nr:P66 protein precursor [Borrelia miyamotoi FR64b]